MLGTNPIKTSGIHQKFYDEVAERVAALAQALKAAPDQAVADAAVQLLLEERPRGKDLTQYGWLSAAQTLAIELLPPRLPCGASAAVRLPTAPPTPSGTGCPSSRSWWRPWSASWRTEH